MTTAPALTIVPAWQIGPQLHHNVLMPDPTRFVAPRMTYPEGSHLDIAISGRVRRATEQPGMGRWKRRFLERLRNEPIGGFWTHRSFHDDPLVGLRQWRPPGSKFANSTWWVLTPDPTAPVLVIRTHADRDAAIAAYPFGPEGDDPADLNYEMLAASFAGVHFDPLDYAEAIRHLNDGRAVLQNWVPGSICWLRWCFLDVRHLVGPHLSPRHYRNDRVIKQREALRRAAEREHRACVKESPGEPQQSPPAAAVGGTREITDAADRGPGMNRAARRQQAGGV